jgi:type II secretion system protein C
MLKSDSKILKFFTLFLFILAVAAIFYAAAKWFAASQKGNQEALSSINEMPIKNAASADQSAAAEDDRIQADRMLHDGRKKASQKYHSCLLNLILRGIINGGKENAQAIIEDTEKKVQKSYKIGDAVGAGILTEIMKNKVVIHINGKDEILMLSSVTFAENGRGRKIKIARSELNTALKNPNRLISQINLKPYVFDDGTGGLLAEEIVPGSLFDKAGFKTGDVIREINGARIENQNRLAALHQGLKYIPLDMVSFEDAEAEAGKLLLWLDNQAGGVAKEVSKVYRKVHSGEGIPVQFFRNGKSRTVIFSVE